MKVLVTGAAGFIGFHVCRYLLARGDQVVGIDNLNDYYEVELKHARLDELKPSREFRFVRMDIADRAAMASLFAAEGFVSFHWIFGVTDRQDVFAEVSAVFQFQTTLLLHECKGVSCQNFRPHVGVITG